MQADVGLQGCELWADEYTTQKPTLYAKIYYDILITVVPGCKYYNIVQIGYFFYENKSAGRDKSSSQIYKYILYTQYILIMCFLISM